MNVYTATFHALSLLVLGATTLAVTSRQLVHTVAYLAISFLGTALIFFLLGAPLLAALEVIIYSGALMVLFLFVVMMVGEGPGRRRPRPTWGRWGLALALLVMFLGPMLVLVLGDPGARPALTLAQATPRQLGLALFERYWLAVELASLLLFVALVGAWLLARPPRPDETPTEARP